MYKVGYSFTVELDTYLWSTRWSDRKKRVDVPTYVAPGTRCVVVRNDNAALWVRIESGEEGYLG